MRGTDELFPEKKVSCVNKINEIPISDVDGDFFLKIFMQKCEDLRAEGHYN